jgi:hypothetical protein
VIPAQFTEAGDFSEGVALVNRGGKQEFIEKIGKTVLTRSMISSRAPSSELQQAAAKNSQSVPRPTMSADLPPLSSIIGAYPGTLMDDPVLKPRFEKLLGSSLPDFEARLEISGTTERNGDWVVGMGNMPHAGGSDNAAYAINIQSGVICAVMRVNQEVRVFGANAVTELPTPLTDWLAQ